MWLQVPGNSTQEGSSLQRHYCPRTMVGVMVVPPFPHGPGSAPSTVRERAGSVGLTLATGFRAAGRSGPCRRSTASKRAAVGWHVLSACEHEFLSPSPGTRPGNHLFLSDHPLCCARLCLSPISCGQSSDSASCSPPDPYLLYPCPLWYPPCTSLVDETGSRFWTLQFSPPLSPPPILALPQEWPPLG